MSAESAPVAPVQRWFRSHLRLILAFTLIAAACGGAEQDSTDQGGSGQSEEGNGDSEGDFGEAFASGGGGLLVFDGEEIPIESAVCVISGDAIDVGTVSETGHRVLLGTNNLEANPISAQILDPDFVQWFPQGVSGDEAQRDGDTFSSNPTEYFNNNDDRIVEVSFTVECP